MLCNSSSRDSGRSPSITYHQPFSAYFSFVCWLEWDERMARIWHNLWIVLGYSYKKSMNIHSIIADLPSSRVSITRRDGIDQRSPGDLLFTLGRELNNSSTYPLCPVHRTRQLLEENSWGGHQYHLDIPFLLRESFSPFWGQLSVKMLGQVCVWLDLLTFSLDRAFAAALFLFY